MADLLQQAAGWLGRMRTAHMSQAVTYSRGEASVQVAATMGSTQYQVCDEYGATVLTTATDFLIAGSDLVLSGVKVEPQLGDRISLADGRVYEVMDPVGRGAGHYRPCDPYGVTLRIHTKQVE
jgi:hypothetical protein